MSMLIIVLLSDVMAVLAMALDMKYGKENKEKL